MDEKFSLNDRNIKLLII